MEGNKGIVSLTGTSGTTGLVTRRTDLTYPLLKLQLAASSNVNACWGTRLNVSRNAATGQMRAEDGGVTAGFLKWDFKKPDDNGAKILVKPAGLFEETISVADDFPSVLVKVNGAITSNIGMSPALPKVGSMGVFIQKGVLIITSVHVDDARE